MKAAYIEDFGDAGVIRYGDLPDPVPGPGEVLVRAEAVAVDTVDTFVRSGAWRTPVTFPLAVGRDLAGTVAAVGEHVSELRAGDRVWTNSAGYGGRPGATAELVAVPQDRLYRLPPGADPVRFVAAVHPGATAYGVLIRRARLCAGETVAVVGANGAVGMCLIQVAAAWGAQVIAVVRNHGTPGDGAPMARRLDELGASRMVIVDDADQAPRAARGVARNTASGLARDGVDVLVDTTGHMRLSDVPDFMNPRGRVVLIAGKGRIDMDQWRFYTRELQLLGFIMSAMTAGELAAAAAWINHQYTVRPLEVSVGCVMGFSDAALAHTLVERGELPRMPDHTVGRLILRPD
ncbi:MAG TPA: zinc-binding dehydrogenase [Streptosporangiaceae bacterium]|nr:zinc-binding dehydrogenase [Streptosporangiaceae bacterium]